MRWDEIKTRPLRLARIVDDDFRPFARLYRYLAKEQLDFDLDEQVHDALDLSVPQRTALELMLTEITLTIWISTQAHGRDGEPDYPHLELVMFWNDHVASADLCEMMEHLVDDPDVDDPVPALMELKMLVDRALAKATAKATEGKA